MDHTAVLLNFTRHIPLDTAQQERIISLLEPCSLPKKSLLLRQGDACRHIYYVESGILRAFHLSETGKDSTLMFARRDWWITDMHCFLNGLPALVNIQAVAPSRVLRLSRVALESLFGEIPACDRWFRILMQNAYCREQLRTIQNLSRPARERYHAFVEKYPEIAREVTQRQIASYLGITPEFLSSLKSQEESGS